MATADELLAMETVEDILVVDLVSRTIAIPPTMKNLGVASDDNVKRVKFKVPRHYGENDLSTFKIYINYLNANKDPDRYEATDMIAEEDVIYFTWLTGRNTFKSSGNVTFSLCCKKYADDDVTVDKEFNTTTATIAVLPGLETSEAIVQEHADAIESLRAELRTIIDDSLGVIENGTY